MSSELDKFVLSYTVEVQSAMKRLEELYEKIAKVNQEGDKGRGNKKEGFRGLITDIAKQKDHVDRMSGSFTALARGVASVSAPLAVVAAGVLAVRAAFKATMATQSEFNDQFQRGFRAGTSPLGVEQFNRGMSRASGGAVSRSQSNSMLNQINEMAFEAQTDPTMMNMPNRMFRQMGINPRGQSPMQIIGEMSKRLAEMPQAQRLAFGMRLGWTPQQTEGLASANGDPRKLSELTKEEQDKMFAAQQEAIKFNAALGDLKERFHELAQTIGTQLLPFLTDAIDGVDKALFNRSYTKGSDREFEANYGFYGFDATVQEKAKKYGVDPNVIKGIIKTESNGNPLAISPKGAKGLMQIMPENFKAYGVDDWRNSEQNIDAGVHIYSDMLKRAHGDKTLALRYYNGGFDKSKWGEQNAEYAGKVTGNEGAPSGTADSMEKSMAEARDAAAQQQLTANLFASAVAQFSNAVDLHQAWAAWAGEVGRANFGPDHNAIGYSRESMQRTMVASSIGQQLGMPTAQIMSGKAARPDVEYALGRLQNGTYLEAIRQAQTARGLASAGAPNAWVSSAAQAARQAALNASFLSARGQDFVGRTFDGPAQQTRGSLPLPSINFSPTFNIQGTQDPHAIAEEVNRILKSEIKNVVLQSSSGISH